MIVPFAARLGVLMVEPFPVFVAPGAAFYLFLKFALGKYFLELFFAVTLYGFVYGAVDELVQAFTLGFGVRC